MHKQILEFLRGMQPGTRCAIFTLGSKLRFIQGFTSDNSLLLAALNDRKNGFTAQKDPSYQSSSDRADDAADVARLKPCWADDPTAASTPSVRRRPSTSTFKPASGP